MIKRKENLMMLINRTSHVFKNMIRIESEKIGLTDTYRPIIMALVKEEGITQRRLCEKVNFSPPTISQTLKKMENEGLIMQVVDDADKRQMRLTLTEKGKQYDNKIHNMFIEKEKQIFKDISLEEQEIALQIVKKVLNNILENGGDKDENI